MNNLVSLEYLDDYNNTELKNAVQNAFSRLNFTSIKPKMKVLIKVCLPEALPQDSGSSTHPAVVRAFADCLKGMGASCIVAESPMHKHSLSFLNDTYLNTGMLEMANQTTCDLNRDLSVTDIAIPDGITTKSITVLDIINKVDAVINIGKLKIDENLGYLGACSNVFGFIPGQMKKLILNRMESLSDFNNFIIDEYEAIKDKIVLNVIDAVVALEANKTQRMLNCLAMSENAYALDAAIFDILGIKHDKTILKQASDRNLFDINKPYKAVGTAIDKFKVEDFALVEFDSGKVINTSAAYFRKHQERPFIDKNVCKGCKICSKICPTNAIMMRYDKNGELYAAIDYKKCIFCNKCLVDCPYSVVKQITPSAYKKMQKQLHKYNENK